MLLKSLFGQGLFVERDLFLLNLTLEIVKFPHNFLLLSLFELEIGLRLSSHGLNDLLILFSELLNIFDLLVNSLLLLSLVLLVVLLHSSDLVLKLVDVVP
jgi:hypothetical protein